MRDDGTWDGTLPPVTPGLGDDPALGNRAIRASLDFHAHEALEGLSGDDYLAALDAAYAPVDRAWAALLGMVADGTVSALRIQYDEGQWGLVTRTARGGPRLTHFTDDIGPEGHMEYEDVLSMMMDVAFQDGATVWVLPRRWQDAGHLAVALRGAGLMLVDADGRPLPSAVREHRCKLEQASLQRQRH